MKFNKTRRIAVVHLDCGIGGAEQLMVLASLALKKSAYTDDNVELVMYTSHHDKSHSFSATTDGRIKVKVFGDWIPRCILGYGTALFSYFKMFYISICMLSCAFLKTFSLEKTSRYYDVILNDQVSAINPLLKLMTRRLIFYCHYPDQLLTNKRSGYIRTFYRRIIDYLEEFGMKYSDFVFVNSLFTRSIYIETFKNIVANSAIYPKSVSFPEVLYPPIYLSDIPSEDVCEKEFLNSKIPIHLLKSSVKPFFLSINRYERKKNIKLSIEAFSILRDEYNINEKLFLIIAGGYDVRVSENTEHFQELVQLANSYGFNVYINNECVQSTESYFSVLFLRSISDKLRWALLRKTIGLIYTPENEHFGIVPCEAMAVGTAVIACNSGGPTESIVNSKTGFLLENNPASFASKMNELYKINKDDIEKLIWENSCKERVSAMFSFELFQKRLNEVSLGNVVKTNFHKKKE